MQLATVHAQRRDGRGLRSRAKPARTAVRVAAIAASAPALRERRRLVLGVHAWLAVSAHAMSQFMQERARRPDTIVEHDQPRALGEAAQLDCAAMRRAAREHDRDSLQREPARPFGQADQRLDDRARSQRRVGN